MIIITVACLALFTGSASIIGVSRLLELQKERCECRKPCACLPQLSRQEKRTLSMFIDDFEITLRRCKRASNVETRRAALQQLQHQYRATSADVEDPDVVLQLLRRYVYNRTQQIAAC